MYQNFVAMPFGLTYVPNAIKTSLERFVSMLVILFKCILMSRMNTKIVSILLFKYYSLVLSLTVNTNVCWRIALEGYCN